MTGMRFPRLADSRSQSRKDLGQVTAVLLAQLADGPPRRLATDKTGKSYPDEDAGKARMLFEQFLDERIPFDCRGALHGRILGPADGRVKWTDAIGKELRISPNEPDRQRPVRRLEPQKLHIRHQHARADRLEVRAPPRL
jgi:hypothetical protein